MKVRSTFDFSQLGQKLNEEEIVLKQPLTVEEPTLVLEREFRLTPEFYYKQLCVLVHMLSVEEWQDKAAFKLNWINTNPDWPLKRFVLYYNQKKNVLKKKYVYRGRPPLLEQKNNVSKRMLIGARERRDAAILGEGFKEIGK